MTNSQSNGAPAYPVLVNVAYPGQQSRLMAALRFPLSVPLLLFSLFLLNGVGMTIWATVLVSGRIPRWLFNFQVALNCWLLRTTCYCLLLTDQYPSFEGDYPVLYNISYPNRLSRWKVGVWKLVTSILHLAFVGFLVLTLVVVTPVAWATLLITGRFPRALHRYTSGVVRWGARVQAYVLSLTDEFPSFALSSDAGAASSEEYVMSSVLGVLATVAVVAGFTAFVALGGQYEVAKVSYEELLTSEPSPSSTVEVHSARVFVSAATDPADRHLLAQANHRLISFDLSVRNLRDGREIVPIRDASFSIRDELGERHKTILVLVYGRIAPVDIDSGEAARIHAVFELPKGVNPASLRFDVLDYISKPRVGETIVFELE